MSARLERHHRRVVNEPRLEQSSVRRVDAQAPAGRPGQQQQIRSGAAARGRGLRGAGAEERDPKEGREGVVEGGGEEDGRGGGSGGGEPEAMELRSCEEVVAVAPRHDYAVVLRRRPLLALVKWECPFPVTSFSKHIRMDAVDS